MGERRVALEEEEELVEELKGRKWKLPNRRASSRALERLSEAKRAAAERPITPLDGKNWEEEEKEEQESEIKPHPLSLPADVEAGRHGRVSG